MSSYITKEGAERLQSELIELRDKQRPKVVQEVADAAAQGDRSENAEYIYGKKKLREMDRKIHFLVKRIEQLQVVDTKNRKDEKGVFFGATVTLKDENGKVSTFQIVGEDELDIDKGKISYKSPLGASLLKRRVGDRFFFHRPMGELELMILDVRYT